MKQAFFVCPKCTSNGIKYDGVKQYSCTECGFEFYQNTASAVAGMLEYNGKVLAVVRNREPGKGMLDFPGGFTDPMESAEDALRREVKEELDIKLGDLEYLCSSPNIYSYKNIEYSTCDVFFVAKLDHAEFNIEESEIADVVWRTKEELNPDEFAFMSMKSAIELYKER